MVQTQWDNKLQSLVIVLILLSVGFVLGFLLPIIDSDLSAQAAIATVQQPVTEVSVHLGTAVGELKFVPNTLTFEGGRRYKLVLDNPSPEKHYFTAKDFADAIWTQKVEAGNVEVKGAIHELELKPGAIAEWLFIPLKNGEFELHCSIPGHSAAGMKGRILVSS
jgi:uncharacterized cupredoxin-like copper-binding protein